MDIKEKIRLQSLPKIVPENCIQSKFNGALYLVKHIDLTSQYIGSGKTLKEALINAQETRKEILSQLN